MSEAEPQDTRGKRCQRAMEPVHSDPMRGTIMDLGVPIEEPAMLQCEPCLLVIMTVRLYRPYAEVKGYHVAGEKIAQVFLLLSSPRSYYIHIRVKVIWTIRSLVVPRPAGSLLTS